MTGLRGMILFIATLILLLFIGDALGYITID